MRRNRLCGAVPRFLLSARSLVLVLPFLASACSSQSSWNSPPGSASAPVAAPGMETASSAASAAPTKVAILLPLSGKGQEMGQAMLKAAQLAMFDIGGNSLELMPKDTNGGAEAAAASAIEEGAQLILGPVFGADAKRVAPLAGAQGLNILPFSTDTGAAGGNSFLMGFVPQTQTEQVLDFAASQGLSRVALIVQADPYGEAVEETYRSTLARLGLVPAGVLRFAPGGLPSAEQLASLTGKIGSRGYGLPFDAVLIAVPGTQAGKISDQLTAAGLSPSFVRRLGTGLWDQPETAREPSLQGAWYAASSPRLRARFEGRYRETYGEAAPRLSSLAYDAMALAVVLAKAGRGYGTASLTSPNGFSGIDGIFRFRPGGLAERGLAILEIRSGLAVVVRDAPSSFAPEGQ